MGFPNLVSDPVGPRIGKKKMTPENWDVTGVVHCLSYCSVTLFMGNIHGQFTCVFQI